MLGAYGAPPLNPAQPSHNSPPPAITSRMFLGENLSLSLLSLGPTCQGHSRPCWSTDGDKIAAPVAQVFRDFIMNYINAEYLAMHAIVCPSNRNADDISEYIIKMLPRLKTHEANTLHI
jgi:hypothetical protein